jgi:hypothetical protein
MCKCGDIVSAYYEGLNRGITGGALLGGVLVGILVGVALIVYYEKKLQKGEKRGIL